MARPNRRRGVVQGKAAVAILEGIGRKGRCRVVHQAGILPNVRGDERFSVPNLAMTCVPVTAKPYIDEPKLIIGMASPSTVRTVKVTDNCAPESVDEV